MSRDRSYGNANRSHNNAGLSWRDLWDYWLARREGRRAARIVRQRRERGTNQVWG